ncbi:hypothetical protein [Fluviicola taffensis]|uniref:hypothetical protein n=1 Tax=Fluviicola taffensis TaxID=191579 RepID=UPI0031381EEE
MNRTIRNTIIILTIFSLLISGIVLDDEIRSFYQIEEGPIDGVLLSIYFLFMHALLIGVVIYSMIQLLARKIRGYLFPIAVCLIHTVIVITLRIKLNIRESSPVVFQAHYDGDINGITLYLRQNKTYKLSDYAVFGETNNYGEYRMSGDTILLSEKHPLGEDRVIMGNKLLVDNTFVLIKQDSKGNFKTDQPFKLRIVTQKRKF